MSKIMIWKHWLKNYFVMLLVLTGALELSYHFMKIEGNIAKQKASWAGNNRGSYENVIFGTSTTLGALGENTERYQHTVNLVTVGAVTLAGNYFLLKRFIKNGGSVKNVYIFFIPEIMAYDFNTENKKRLEFFHFIFTNQDEQQETISASSTQLGDTQRSYMENRSLYLRGLLDMAITSKNKNSSKVNMEKLLTIGIGKLSKTETVPVSVVSERSAQDFQLSQESIYFLRKFSTLTREHNIHLTLVMAPLQDSVYKGVVDSGITNEIQRTLVVENDFISCNEFQQFPNYAFKDSIHLKDDWAKLYEQLIFKNIIKTSLLKTQ